MSDFRSQSMSVPDSIDITWHDGAYYVSVPNWQGGTVYTSEHVASLKARNAELESALRCISVPADVAAMKSRIHELEGALRDIAAIENKDFGPDWEEIEEARDIARAILQPRNTE